jgi:hypothetical protein
MDKPDPLDGLTEFDIAVRFASQLIGADGVADGPPPSDSPLGRVQALTRFLEGMNLPRQAIDGVVKAMWSEEWRAMGLNVDSETSPWDE